MRVIVAELEDKDVEEVEDDLNLIEYKYLDMFKEYYQDAETYYVAYNNKFTYKCVVSSYYTNTEVIAEEEEDKCVLKEMVLKKFKDFSDVFSKVAVKRLPEQSKYSIPIDLQLDTTSPFSKIYNINEMEQKAIEKFIAENLKKEYIRESKSPAAAPGFFIKKKNQSLYIVIDYRRLNDITIKN